MLAPWVVDEMKTANLKDERLNDRLREVLAQLAAHPTASIPAACGGRAELEAAYRLFDNDKATFDNILQSHPRHVIRRPWAKWSAWWLSSADILTVPDPIRPARRLAGPACNAC